MIGLSQTTVYAIQALACLEGSSRSGCLVRQVAERTGVPRAYLARIINRLAHQGIVATKRGYQGGATLARPANQISLLQVVEAVEGKDWIGPCLLGRDSCPDSFCPTHDFWQDIRQRIEAKLAETTVADMLAAKPSGESAVARASCPTVKAAASAANRVPCQSVVHDKDRTRA